MPRDYPPLLWRVFPGPFERARGNGFGFDRVGSASREFSWDVQPPGKRPLGGRELRWQEPFPVGAVGPRIVPYVSAGGRGSSRMAPLPYDPSHFPVGLGSPPESRRLRIQGGHDRGEDCRTVPVRRRDVMPRRPAAALPGSSFVRPRGEGAVPVTGGEQGTSVRGSLRKTSDSFYIRDMCHASPGIIGLR